LSPNAPSFLAPTDTFVRRHVAPSEPEIREMLSAVGCGSLEQLIGETVPASIRLRRPLDLGPERGEHELLGELRGIAAQNQVFRSFVGLGYHGTITPPVIQRNVLENPGWYTQYTPYQAEISQGRLEALLDYQTMIADLTALPLANASLLDEGTAAAEAMAMCHEITRGKRATFFVDERCHPQTVAVVQTRAEALGWEVVVGDHGSFDFAARPVFGALVQYPTSDGEALDYAPLAQAVHASGAVLVVAADLLALTLLRAPG
jgi:glycine dehydrogenase